MGPLVIHKNLEMDTQKKDEMQKKKLKEACEEFEAVLTGYLLKSMRESVMRAEEPDSAREMYEGLMDETLAKEVSRSNGTGLGKLLYDQLVPLIKEEPRVAPPPAAPDAPEEFNRKTRAPGAPKPTIVRRG